MVETARQLRSLRFENFEVDLRSGELRKAGMKLKFGGQPFQVLSILLEQPGDVVTREELQKRLWPDTFVDVDHNLNTAINKIREALGDSAESPRFVETLPRRGYRFIGELEPPVPSVVAIEPVRVSHARRPWLKITAGVLAVSVIALAVIVGYRWSRPQNPQGQATLTALPFTASPGRAIYPAFSPDGSRIAFAWNGDPVQGSKGFDLYVKALGSETLLRLTQHPSVWISPAWSPDGTQIAFQRVAGADTGIYVVPALGGPERKVRSTRSAWTGFTTISWSPDGKSIAFSDLLPGGGEHTGISLLSTETLETRQLPSTPGCVDQGEPAFSHSGEYLAYWCLRSLNEVGLYSLSLRGGQPKLISLFRRFPVGLTWSADDKRLIYSLSLVCSSELGEVDVANGSVKQLAVEGGGEFPSVPDRGDKLAFGSPYNSSFSIWRKDLLHPEAPAKEVMPSSRAQYDGQYSPNGKHIAFASERSGVQGVWIANEDGSNLVQVSNPAHISGSPQWSPDGSQVAFDSHPLDRWEVYVADVSERVPRKLATNISDIYRPHWSHDGRWIYFRSDEVGRTGIYRCPSSGGDAIALSRDNDGMNAQESFDGKTVYFASRPSRPVLERVSLLAVPGTVSEVDGLPRLVYDALWSLSSGGTYFVAADAPRSVRYFDFATGQIRPVFEGNKDFGSGLSVSPDGRWMLYSQVDDVNSDIMLVDHFDSVSPH
jgi:Tol biopolymer transport system component/DNA-binding winged helix-turn-helix (wHTH) protein